MAKKSKRITVRYEKDQSGCMWGLISLFDFRHGRASRKLLADKKRPSRQTVGMIVIFYTDFFVDLKIFGLYLSSIPLTFDLQVLDDQISLENHHILSFCSWAVLVFLFSSVFFFSARCLESLYVRKLRNTLMNN